MQGMSSLRDIILDDNGIGDDGAQAGCWTGRRDFVPSHGCDALRHDRGLRVYCIVKLDNATINSGYV